MEKTFIRITMPLPTVSVVIPVKNEVAKIRACIDGILSQTVPVQEIIVIDSGSTDGTIDILREYALVKIIEIPPAEFNHGETRNLGVRLATGEFVLLTVGDARPFNNHWIEELLNGFVDDEVAGVCGQQVVPHETDKNPVEWFKPVSSPELYRYHYPIPGSFDLLSPIRKKTACSWDDVNAMYRRNILLKIPFRKTSYAEDLLWCRDALREGHAVVYNYSSRVYHYHNENPDFVYKRTFTVLYYQFIGFQYVPEMMQNNLRRGISVIKNIIKNKRLGIYEKYFWIKYNFNNSSALKRGIKDFIYWSNMGLEKLDEQHNKICKQPPIPVK
jgi:rhamnosyltransferase